MTSDDTDVDKVTLCYRPYHDVPIACRSIIFVFESTLCKASPCNYSCEAFIRNSEIRKQDVSIYRYIYIKIFRNRKYDDPRPV